MTSVHLSTARKMLESPDPVNLKVWTKAGEILELRNCVSLRFDFYKGTRRVKLLDSRQIRQIRDTLIFSINDMEVFL